MDNKKTLEDLYRERLEELIGVKLHNDILEAKINIAIQGLEVIISMGDSMNESVATQTVKAMEECKKDSSQDKKVE